MEEPLFIKHEPDVEESSYIETDINMPTGQFEEIKVEPCPVFDGDSSVEEKTSEIIKEEHEFKVWKEELDIGNISYGLQPSCFSSNEQMAKPIESNSRQKTKKRKGRSSSNVVLANCHVSGKAAESEIFPKDHLPENMKYLSPVSTIIGEEPSTFLGVQTNDIFSCGICNKSFERKCYLKRHILTHADQKPHVCSVCGRSFVRKEQIDCHLSIHRGIKLFVCNICGKRFSQRSSLERHGVVHTGNKPYSCKLCFRTFGDLSNFRRHLFLHSGQKPYFCETCGKSFSTQRNLKRHQVIHLDDKPFSCSTCGCVYRAPFMLRRHMAKHKPHGSVSNERTDGHIVTTVSVIDHVREGD